MSSKKWNDLQLDAAQNGRSKVGRLNRLSRVSQNRAAVQEEDVMKQTAIVTVMAAWLIGTMSSASFAASDFEGMWKVKDTAGKQFEITLSGGGAAKATRGEGMTGSWKEEGNAAVITWNTGWITKITKNGNRYEKTAYRKGEPLTGKPANSSDAEKVK